jgi:protein O-GlcNAc transferase
MLWRALRAAFRPRASAGPLIQRALDLRSEGRNAEAEALLRRAVREHPEDPGAATNLAVALLDQDRGQEAVSWLERALKIDDRFGPAHFNYGHVLRAGGRLADAITHYAAAARAQPPMPEASEALMQALLEACDWDGAEALAEHLRSRAARDPAREWMPHVSPHTAVYLGLEPAQCKAVAAFHAPKPADRAFSSADRTGPRPERLRIAYLSRDFREHAVGHVLRTVFAHHDRSRFEVHAYSFGIDDGSVYRRAIVSSVERFVDISSASDDQAARAIADAGIDVLIDLMGHTTGNRLGILARRPAPVQAHYLGYPATTGASYVDYFISDPIATPPGLEPDFSERVVHVPDCFMVSDGADALAAAQGSRTDHGLPDNAYVFCNFSDSARLDRSTFDLWLQILERAPAALLWLRKPNALAVDNLSACARARGVAPARLVFADRLPGKSAHLGRLACADLALDTLGWYNGHSTTADLLWAGVPVLTSPGETFASRVAASLVAAAGLHEIVAANPEDYADIAVALAHDPVRTRAFRNRLLDGRASAPFFDTARLVRGLESTYETMFAAKMRPPTGL